MAKSLLSRAYHLALVATLFWASTGCGVILSPLLDRDRPPNANDPIFGLPTPILFAHRGGVLEAPQSTELAFCHALKHAGANVLELDVQRTRDQKFVVWHGPELDTVVIEGQPLVAKDRCRRKINEYDWKELEDKAWVGDPGQTDNALAHVPHDPKRQLMLLRTFLDRFRCTPLNIELKESIQPEDVSAFVDTLEDSLPCPTQPARPIVVVSLCETLQGKFRELRRKHLAGFSLTGNIGTIIRSWFLPYPRNHGNRALQTSYLWLDGGFGRRVIGQMHRDHGAVHVFISNFLGFSLDQGDTVDEQKIRTLLSQGIDGIMTDRPTQVRKVINAWRDLNQTGVTYQGNGFAVTPHDGVCTACGHADGDPLF